MKFITTITPETTTPSVTTTTPPVTTTSTSTPIMDLISKLKYSFIKIIKRLLFFL